MTAKIATVVAMTLACGVAVAADSHPAITTTDGKTYDHITDLRSDPDGLYIEYSPGGKGIGSAKIKFSRLSADLQKQYGYDPAAARKYEEDSYRADQVFQAFADRQQAVADKARADAQARDFQQEMMLSQQTLAAPPPGATDMGDSGTPYYDNGSSYLGGGYGYGARASSRAWTGATYQGTVPFSTLFTPLGYSPNKQTVIPATPRGNSGRGVIVARGGGSKGF